MLVWIVGFKEEIVTEGPAKILFYKDRREITFVNPGAAGARDLQTDKERCLSQL